MADSDSKEEKEEKSDYQLASWQIQQLVEDLEKEGGRKAHVGKLIYDKNIGIYGESGSEKRKAFRNFKNNLRRQTIKTYWNESIIGRQVQPHPLTLSEYHAFNRLEQSKKDPKKDPKDDTKMNNNDDWSDEVHPDDPAGQDGSGAGGVQFKTIDGGVTGAAGNQILPPVPPPVNPPIFTPPKVKQAFQKPRASIEQKSNPRLSLDGSLVDAFSGLSVFDEHQGKPTLPNGDGTLKNPIYVPVDLVHPERNHGFCIHAFPNMLVGGQTRNIVEISHQASLCDLEGTILLQTKVPNLY